MQRWPASFPIKAGARSTSSCGRGQQWLRSSASAFRVVVA